jgi:uncharacterized circularly permuted ATP-grasp superfamily protein/uncharacterized alpha-E superfamily protein
MRGVSVATGEFDETRGAVARYGERVGELTGIDELIVGGRPRAVAADLAATLDLLGVGGLLARRAETLRLVEDDGVTYGTPLRAPDGDAGRGVPPRWRLDPLPVVIDTTEWKALEAGVRQRAELLDLILTDVYGARRLLRRGVVPPEVIFGHPEFLRVADQIRLPGPRQLFLAAMDLGRDVDGAWTVIADRTQAPSGAGYAMENRRIVSRVMPALYRDTQLERLRSFFHTVRAGLQEVAPATAEAPRVVMLTPGPGSETAFDQSFLSTLLGYPVVSGEDLTVRGGRVFLRALGRLEPVDVVVRRVDSWFADPLELRAASRLGVPGLLEAARMGTVSVVNTFGAGVLENPGLLPFLPRACEELLGEPLALPSAPTWWCGDPRSLSHVLAHLDELVVKPIARSVEQASVFGWELTSTRRDDLRRRILAAPHAWCAQEPVALSTAPAVTSRGLEPRRLILRAFAAAQGGEYHLMSGGLARVAARGDSVLVSNLAGALAKDVWVLSPQSVTTETLADISPVRLTQPIAVGAAGPSSRTAEDLFWLGRYAERAEDAVRLLRVIDDLAEDWTFRPGTPGQQSLHILLRTLTQVTTTYPGFIGPRAEAQLAAPQAELLGLVLDAGRHGTLAHAVGRTIETAHAVRDQLSLDTWIVLGSLDRVLDELVASVRDGAERPLQPSLARMLEGLLALAGLGAESMVRDTAWHYLDAGRRIERALQVTSLLRHSLAEGPYPTAVEALVLESVLIAGESIITYRRRQQRRPRPGSVVELLLLDRLNPRAVAHQLDRLADDLRHLPQPEHAPPGPAVRERLGMVTARVREVDPLDTAELPAALAAVHSALTDVATSLADTHFVHGAPQRAITGTPGWYA